ncbi:hypothetical protein QOT17_017655 [Balamuthia mandrillaris]
MLPFPCASLVTRSGVGTVNGGALGNALLMLPLQRQQQRLSTTLCGGMRNLNSSQRALSLALPSPLRFPTRLTANRSLLMSSSAMPRSVRPYSHSRPSLASSSSSSTSSSSSAANNQNSNNNNKANSTSGGEEGIEDEDEVMRAYRASMEKPLSRYDVAFRGEPLTGWRKYLKWFINAGLIACISLISYYIIFPVPLEENEWYQMEQQLKERSRQAYLKRKEVEDALANAPRKPQQ